MHVVPVDDGAIAAVHGALGVDGRGQEAVRAAAAGVAQLGGGQRGQDAGSGGGSGAGRDEAVVSALEARRSQDGVGQDAGQQVIRLGGINREQLNKDKSAGVRRQCLLMKSLFGII